MDYKGSATRVWVADPVGKRLEIRPVKIGRTLVGLVEVLQGLTAGESIVTAEAFFIDRVASGD